MSNQDPGFDEKGWTATEGRRVKRYLNMVNDEDADTAYGEGMNSLLLNCLRKAGR